MHLCRSCIPSQKNGLTYVDQGKWRLWNGWKTKVSNNSMQRLKCISFAFTPFKGNVSSLL